MENPKCRHTIYEPAFAHKRLPSADPSALSSEEAQNSLKQRRGLQRTGYVYYQYIHACYGSLILLYYHDLRRRIQETA